MGLVPTVDLTDPEAPRAIDRACREVGFFQIVGHGLDPASERAAREAATEFFALPLDRKLALAIPDGEAYGYGPFAGERLAASRGEHTPPDLKETFSVGPFADPPPPARADPSAAFVFSPNRWPASLPGFEAALRAQYEAMATLAERVMSAMAVGLGLSADFFVPAIDHHTSALRVLHYPDVSGLGVEPGQLRAGAHSDYGTLTLLSQDDAPGGLEVRDVDGDWHPVPAVEGPTSSTSAMPSNAGPTTPGGRRCTVSSSHRSTPSAAPSGTRWPSSTTRTGTPGSPASPPASHQVNGRAMRRSRPGAT